MTQSGWLDEAFDRMMCGKPDYGLRSALREAFMAGAHAYGVTLDKAVASGDPEVIAAVQDELAREIQERNNSEGGDYMIRVCPKRDAICPHGMNCPYVVDRYTCREEPKRATHSPSDPAAQSDTGDF